MQSQKKVKGDQFLYIKLMFIFWEISKSAAMKISKSTVMKISKGTEMEIIG